MPRGAPRTDIHQWTSPNAHVAPAPSDLRYDSTSYRTRPRAPVLTSARSRSSGLGEISDVGRTKMKISYNEVSFNPDELKWYFLKNLSLLSENRKTIFCSP